MNNDLATARNRFSAAHPEQRHTLNTRTWGVLNIGESGPALLLLPGTLGRADIFWNQIAALAGQARILALSYPETGSIEDWVEDINTLMVQHKMTSATVLGSSLGGYVAQYFAARHPEKTEALIAANTLHSVAMLADLPPYNADLDTLPAEMLMQGFMDGLLQWKTEEPQRVDLIALLIEEVSGRIPVPELRNRLKALKNGPQLPPLTLKPQQIVTVESGDDRLIPPPVREAVRARLAPHKTVHFEHGSHFPYLTEAAAYTALIAEVLGLDTPSEATP